MVVEVVGTVITIPQPWVFYLCPVKSRSNLHSFTLGLADGSKEKPFLESTVKATKKGAV